MVASVVLRASSKHSRAVFLSSSERSDTSRSHTLLNVTSMETRAEDFPNSLIGTVRRECLDRMLVFGEAHLRQIFSTYAALSLPQTQNG